MDMIKKDQRGSSRVGGLKTERFGHVQRKNCGMRIYIGQRMSNMKFFHFRLSCCIFART